MLAYWGDCVSSFKTTGQQEYTVSDGINSGRLMIIGQTEDKKLLAMVLTPKDKGEYYPVTAYTASGKLRRIYYQEKGKEEKS